MADESKITRHRSLPELVNPSTQMRLLKFLSNSLDGAPEYCLEVHDRASSPPYNAISYTWGEPEPKQSIVLNGHNFEVQQNCYYALRQCRENYKDDYLWIDSICIDQSERSREKSEQVQVMGTIYQRAIKVLACVGPHEHDSEFLSREVQRCLDESGCRPPPEYLEYDDMRLHALEGTPRMSVSVPWSAQDRERLTKAVEYFFTRPYWTRVWIVQELCLARKIKVLCGFDILEWAGFSLLRTHNFPDHLPSAAFKSLDHFLDQITFEDSDRLTLMDHIANFAAFDCKNEKDHVYGLLSLARNATGGDKDFPPVDYSKSNLQVALDVTYATKNEGAKYFGQVESLISVLNIDFGDAAFRSLVDKRKLPRNTIANNEIAQEDFKLQRICDALLHRSLADMEDIRSEFDGRRFPGRIMSVRRLSASLSSDPSWRLTTRLSRTNSGLSSRTNEVRHSLEEALSLQQPLSVKTICVDGELAGVVCGEARPGDFLIASGLTDVYRGNINGQHVLVVRKSCGHIFNIMGQGMVLPDFQVVGYCGENSCSICHPPRSFALLLSEVDAFVMAANFYLLHCDSDATGWATLVGTGIQGQNVSSGASFAFCSAPN